MATGGCGIRTLVETCGVSPAVRSPRDSRQETGVFLGRPGKHLTNSKSRTNDSTIPRSYGDSDLVSRSS